MTTGKRMLLFALVTLFMVIVVPMLVNYPDDLAVTAGLGVVFLWLYYAAWTIHQAIRYEIAAYRERHPTEVPTNQSKEQ